MKIRIPAPTRIGQRARIRTQIWASTVRNRGGSEGGDASIGRS
jgi:hypothetical protein